MSFPEENQRNLPFLIGGSEVLVTEEPINGLQTRRVQLLVLLQASVSPPATGRALCRAEETEAETGVSPRLSPFPLRADVLCGPSLSGGGHQPNGLTTLFLQKK